MKKWLLLLFSVFLILPVSQAMASSSTDVNQFTQNVEKNLVKGDFYYNKNSVKILKSIKVKGNVTKVIKTDDPATEADETKIDKYQSNLIVALVQIKEKRDGIFYFKKNEFYYYDADKSEFLVYPNIYDNPQVEKFFQDNIKEIGKDMTMSSQLLFLLILSSLFIMSYLIFIFHNENRTTQKQYYFDENFTSSL